LRRPGLSRREFHVALRGAVHLPVVPVALALPTVVRLVTAARTVVHARVFPERPLVDLRLVFVGHDWSSECAHEPDGPLGPRRRACHDRERESGGDVPPNRPGITELLCNGPPTAPRAGP